MEESNEVVEQVTESVDVVEKDSTDTVKEATQEQPSIDIEKITAEITERIKSEQAESEKLKKMNEAEKKSYELEKKAKELEAKEMEIQKQGLRIKAHEILVDKGLAPSLLNILDYSNAENCNKSIEAVAEVLNSAIEKGIQERLKGETPKKEVKSATKSDIAKMDFNEFQKMYENGINV